LGTSFESVHRLSTKRPSVSIIASHATVRENETKPGSWLISREGDLTGKLVLDLELSGSAKLLEDYHLISPIETATFEPGESSKTLNLFPVDDELFEEVETVHLRILPGANYVIGRPDQATITIEDNDPSPAPIEPTKPVRPRLLITRDKISAQLSSGINYELQESSTLRDWETVARIEGEGDIFEHPFEIDDANQRFFRLILAK